MCNLRDSHVAVAVLPLDPKVNLVVVLAQVVGEQAQLLHGVRQSVSSFNYVHIAR